MAASGVGVLGIVTVDPLQHSRFERMSVLHAQACHMIKDAYSAGERKLRAALSQTEVHACRGHLRPVPRRLRRLRAL
jgi:hypothetical protein